MKFLNLSKPVKRVIAINIAGIGVIVLVLLAASLQSLELEPAKVYFSNEGSDPEFYSGVTQLVDSIGSMTLREAFMLIGGLLILFVLILAMLSPEARKRLIKMILRVSLTAWAIYYALTKFRPEGIFGAEPQVTEMDGSSEIILTPPPYTPPEVPSWMNYAVSFLVVLVFAGIGFWLYRVLRPPKHQFQSLARAARSALKDLSAGREWEDTVIQCYARMSEAVDQERGLHRQRAMTPNEFASRLEKAGLPSEPVRRLTRLFEKARYGGRISSREDVNEAVSCLTAILHAVGAKS